jgi:plastocyanin
MVVALAAAVAGCGGSDYGTAPGATCTPTATRICMTASTFNPTTLTVSAGTEVTWLNGSSLAHTVTSSPSSTEVFDYNVGVGGSVSRTFNTAGTYEYYCELHGTPTDGMRGTITVP